MTAMETMQKLLSGPKRDRDLDDLCHHPGLHIDPKRLDDDLFGLISSAMLAAGMPTSWSKRPRTYFILYQLNRRNLMSLFVHQDLDDGCIPYPSRGALPEGNSSLAFNPLEAEDFLKWQQVCESAALQLERGLHCTFADADELFTKEKRLGQGSSGNSVVDKVISKATGKVYARKKIRRDKYPKDAQRTYKRELQNLTKVGEHVHLIRVRASYTDRKYFGLLLEPVAEENLKAHLLRISSNEPSVRAKLCSLYGCMANVVAFLHDTMLLHKDIKLDNFLLSKGKLILTDFGTSFDWSKTGQSMTMSNRDDARTPRYASPEVVRESRFHRASDIWSLGVVFLEMTTILRGETLLQLEKFLLRENAKTAHIYANLAAVHRWIQNLTEQSGPRIDNEPLAWTRRMLDPIMENRPTAPGLYNDIATSQMGRFCGQCCLHQIESDVSSQSDLLDSDEEQGIHNHQQSIKPHSDFTEPEPETPIPGAFPVEHQPAHQADARRNQSRQTSSMGQSFSSPGISKVRQLRTLRPKLQSNDAQLPSEHGATSSSVPLMTTSAQSREESTVVRKTFSLQPVRGMLGWWGGTKTPKSKPITNTKESAKTVNYQMMDHFLDTLPSEPQGFDTLPNQSQLSLVHANRSVVRPTPDKFPESTTPVSTQTGDPRPTDTRLIEKMPAEEERQKKPATSLQNAVSFKIWLPERGLERHQFMTGDTQVSKKHRNSLTLAYLNPNHSTGDSEEQDQPQKQLLHFPSDSDLRTALAPSGQDFKEIIADLRATDFGKLNSSNHSELPTPQLVQGSDDDERNGFDDQSSSPMLSELQEATSPLVPVLKVSDQPTEEPGRASAEAIRVGKTKSKKSSKPSNKRNVRFEEGNVGDRKPEEAHSTLASYLNQTTGRPRQWESASTLMRRILNDKASVANTSEASARTRKLSRQSPSILYWNDKTYHYLPYFVQEGKVPAVRMLLSKGCNPGTNAKPRWRPMFYAVKGRTHKHNKCLLELLRAEANVNAKDSHGKTYLHHAVSQPTWSGYSTTVYMLLSFKANLNIADNRGIVPFIQLLLGSGPLDHEEQTALLLMLAPNFDAQIDLLETSLEDNVLHLAIRRKDPYALDAILDKVSTHPRKDSLFTQKNASGFTPIILVMNSFTFRDQDDSELGLRLLELLLQAGANPNSTDRTSGNGPLHLAVGTYHNLELLNLLLQYNASPSLKNLKKITPATLLANEMSEDATNSWFSSLYERFKDDKKWYP